ncbi:hypothetical protein D049_1653B, partial [Vibrio parahaemolyticus VPTS-2010]
ATGYKIRVPTDHFTADLSRKVCFFEWNQFAMAGNHDFMVSGKKRRGSNCGFGYGFFC